MSSTSINALTSLKNKMQAVRDELDKYRDLYEEKCRELNDEVNKRNEVSCDPTQLFIQSTNLNAVKPKFHLARLVTSRHDTTRSTFRAHAVWLCRACRTARLETLVTTCSTRSTRRMYRVVSRRDVT